jgi:short-subunit dehydrogenase
LVLPARNPIAPLPAKERADELTVSGFHCETNVFGTLAVTRAFAPILGSNGGGGIINVLSVLARLSSPGAALYCASKAASWSLTNATRLELRTRTRTSWRFTLG